ncbi:Dnah7 [Symbiodinium sp. KB8]|nr:Dnah7 [Symbiodinium sp. KB8]
MARWLKMGPPSSYWVLASCTGVPAAVFAESSAIAILLEVPCFYFPQGFMTCSKQAVVRTRIVKLVRLPVSLACQEEHGCAFGRSTRERLRFRSMHRPQGRVLWRRLLHLCFRPLGELEALVFWQEMTNCTEPRLADPPARCPSGAQAGAAPLAMVEGHKVLVRVIISHPEKRAVPLDAGWATVAARDDDEICKVKMRQADGVNVHGLFLQGAGWDVPSKKMVESEKAVLFKELPVIWVQVVEEATFQKVSTEPGRYTCPLYKTSLRKGTLVSEDLTLVAVQSKLEALGLGLLEELFRPPPSAEAEVVTKRKLPFILTWGAAGLQKKKNVGGDRLGGSFVPKTFRTPTVQKREDGRDTGKRGETSDMTRKAKFASLTGHSTNFVCYFRLPSNEEELWSQQASAQDQGHWVRRGVALLCMLDD